MFPGIRRHTDNQDSLYKTRDAVERTIDHFNLKSICTSLNAELTAMPQPKSLDFWVELPIYNIFATNNYTQTTLDTKNI